MEFKSFGDGIRCLFNCALDTKVHDEDLVLTAPTDPIPARQYYGVVWGRLLGDSTAQFAIVPDERRLIVVTYLEHECDMYSLWKNLPVLAPSHAPTYGLVIDDNFKSLSQWSDDNICNPDDWLYQGICLHGPQAKRVHDAVFTMVDRIQLVRFEPVDHACVDFVALSDCMSAIKPFISPIKGRPFTKGSRDKYIGMVQMNKDLVKVTGAQDNLCVSAYVAVTNSTLVK